MEKKGWNGGEEDKDTGSRVEVYEGVRRTRRREMDRNYVDKDGEKRKKIGEGI